MRVHTIYCILCLERASPVLYLGNLHSLGANLENVSFLILKDWVKRPGQGQSSV